MRITHLVNGSTEGIVGVERRVLYLATAQKARGSSVTVVVDHPGLLAEACDQHGVPVVVVQSLTQDCGFLEPVENAIQDLIIQFKSTAAELIHCHTLPVAAQAIPAGNQIKVPCVLTFNGPGLLMAARDAGLRFASILVTRARFEELKKSGMPDVYYVPNGTSAASLARPAETGPSGRPNLIFVGSMIARKGVDVAIHAMAELRQRLGPDCPTLNIYGDGEQARYLKEMVTVLHLQDIVRFWGFQSDILDHCPSTDVLVMSSRSETGPQVVLEAMSRGMPIAASDVGEVAEMLPDPRYGRVVPVESIVALADAIESLLSDIADGEFNPDSLMERHRSRYSDEIMAERIEAVYQQVLLDNSSAA
jgi:glycosyltransferase involved in cell wall biosynthesis